MRQYILTKREREAIRQYLENGVRTDEMRVIIHRARRFYSRLSEDLCLIEALLKKEGYEARG